MSLQRVHLRKKRRVQRAMYALVLSFSILLGGHMNGIAAGAEGNGQPMLPSYYAEMSKLYAETYDDYNLTLSWYSSGTNTGFDIYRKAAFQEDYEWLGSVENEQYNLLEFQDIEFRRGFTYTYRVVAYQETEEGYLELGTETGAWKLAIQQVEIESVKRAKQVNAKLTWSKSSGVDGYEIYKKTAGGKYKRAMRIASEDTLKYTVKNISKKKNTYYKIRAYIKENGKYAYGSFSPAEKLAKLDTSKLAVMFRKLQKKYPNGKYWNHAGKSKYTSTTVTSRPCYHSAYDGLADTCNYYFCPDGVLGYQCYGFAWMMSDLIYGKKAKIKNFYSFSKCKAGDVIRYSGHSVIIVSKHSNYITAGECNYGDTCMIKWGRKIYKSELTGAKYSRRYK